MKVCLARVDRIGDFILTLPSEKAWLSVSPQDSVEWLLSDSVAFVAQSVSPPLKAFYAPSPKGFLGKVRALLKLVTTLKEKNFDHVVAIHVPWWVAGAFFLAGIPRRTGVASQWYSWVFYNSRLRQKRSRSEKNEAHYNLDLIAFALGKPGFHPSQLSPGRLEASKTRAMTWAQTLKKKNVDLHRLVVIHPGMGGSAQNWPLPYYRELAQKLIAENYSVVVTGSAADQTIIAKAKILEVPGVISSGSTTGEDLLAILSLAKVVVAPSTGVAHLAASLGVKTVGLYSPVKVQAPTRWAPLGNHVIVFVPKVPCPGVFKCLGEKCQYYDCMGQMSVDSVARCVMDKL